LQFSHTDSLRFARTRFIYRTCRAPAAHLDCRCLPFAISILVRVLPRHLRCAPALPTLPARFGPLACHLYVTPQTSLPAFAHVRWRCTTRAAHAGLRFTHCHALTGLPGLAFTTPPTLHVYAHGLHLAGYPTRFAWFTFSRLVWLRSHLSHAVPALGLRHLRAHAHRTTPHTRCLTRCVFVAARLHASSVRTRTVGTRVARILVWTGCTRTLVYRICPGFHRTGLYILRAYHTAGFAQDGRSTVPHHRARCAAPHAICTALHTTCLRAHVPLRTRGRVSRLPLFAVCAHTVYAPHTHTHTFYRTLHTLPHFHTSGLRCVRFGSFAFYCISLHWFTICHWFATHTRFYRICYFTHLFPLHHHRLSLYLPVRLRFAATLHHAAPCVPGCCTLPRFTPVPHRTVTTPHAFGIGLDAFCMGYTHTTHHTDTTPLRCPRSAFLRACVCLHFHARIWIVPHVCGAGLPLHTFCPHAHTVAHTRVVYVYLLARFALPLYAYWFYADHPLIRTTALPRMRSHRSPTLPPRFISSRSFTRIVTVGLFTTPFLYVVAVPGLPHTRTHAAFCAFTPPLGLHLHPVAYRITLHTAHCCLCGSHTLPLPRLPRFARHYTTPYAFTAPPCCVRGLPRFTLRLPRCRCARVYARVYAPRHLPLPPARHARTFTCVRARFHAFARYHLPPLSPLPFPTPPPLLHTAPAACAPPTYRAAAHLPLPVHATCAGLPSPGLPHYFAVSARAFGTSGSDRVPHASHAAAARARRFAAVLPGCRAPLGIFTATHRLVPVLRCVHGFARATALRTGFCCTAVWFTAHHRFHATGSALVYRVCLPPLRCHTAHRVAADGSHHTTVLPTTPPPHTPPGLPFWILHGLVLPFAVCSLLVSALFAFAHYPTIGLPSLVLHSPPFRLHFCLHFILPHRLPTFLGLHTSSLPPHIARLPHTLLPHRDFCHAHRLPPPHRTCLPSSSFHVLRVALYTARLHAVHRWLHTRRIVCRTAHRLRRCAFALCVYTHHTRDGSARTRTAPRCRMLPCVHAVLRSFAHTGLPHTCVRTHTARDTLTHAFYCRAPRVFTPSILRFATVPHTTYYTARAAWFTTLRIPLFAWFAGFPHTPGFASWVHACTPPRPTGFTTHARTHTFGSRVHSLRITPRVLYWDPAPLHHTAPRTYRTHCTFYHYTLRFTHTALITPGSLFPFYVALHRFLLVRARCPLTLVSRYHLWLFAALRTTRYGCLRFAHTFMGSRWDCPHAAPPRIHTRYHHHSWFSRSARFVAHRHYCPPPYRGLRCRAVPPLRPAPAHRTRTAAHGYTVAFCYTAIWVFTSFDYLHRAHTHTTLGYAVAAHTCCAHAGLHLPAALVCCTTVLVWFTTPHCQVWLLHTVHPAPPGFCYYLLFAPRFHTLIAVFTRTPHTRAATRLPALQHAHHARSFGLPLRLPVRYTPLWFFWLFCTLLRFCTFTPLYVRLRIYAHAVTSLTHIESVV